MANFKPSTGQGWPDTGYNKLIENDPQIVKVPMDNTGWGSRKGTMAKARNPESGGNGKLAIRHVDPMMKGGKGS